MKSLAALVLALEARHDALLKRIAEIDRRLAKLASETAARTGGRAPKRTTSSLAGAGHRKRRGSFGAPPR